LLVEEQVDVEGVQLGQEAVKKTLATPVVG